MEEQRKLTITLAHGSGGQLTHRLLDNGVFKHLANDLLDTQHDGAIFSPFDNSDEGEKLAFSTDSFVVSPIFFPGGNIGELAINGTVNDLAMCGAKPKYLSLSFIIEEGLLMEEFEKILLSIASACKQADVQIVTGDTKVVEHGKGDKIFINTSGVGVVHKHAQISPVNIKPDDVIIVSNQIAVHGIAIMSKREGLEFETDTVSDTRPLNHAVKKLLDTFGSDIHLLRDPTRGGLATVLVEIAQSTGLGIDIFQDKIPVAEQVNGACEVLGLDPLYVANEGVFIAVVEKSIAEDVVHTLRSLDTCTEACVIGHCTEEHRKQLVMNSSFGGRRAVGMLSGDQLPRIC